VSSWASLDYFGRWKALHYAAKRFYAPLLLSVADYGKTMKIHVTSDLVEPVDVQIRWRLETLDGKALQKGEQVIRAGQVNLMTAGCGIVHSEDQVSDGGALHGKAILIEGKGKVLSYKMTSQCASGSGQFLENIARYLGIGQDEIGTLSKKADNPEVVSSICAVLAETDVINMVSRGISAPNILKGIHLSMAGRLSKLLKSIGATGGVVMVTGGLALDDGLVAALAQDIAAMKNMSCSVRSHPDSIYAGAIGAALWGAYRHDKLTAKGDLPRAA